MSETAVQQRAGEQAMKQLQNGWYNTLVSALNLNPESFQLVQASQPLGDTSKMLWQVFDSVPPKTLTQVFDASQFNSFHDDYKGVVLTILPQGGDQWKRTMGDEIHDWNTYKRSDDGEKAIRENGIVDAFETWADIHLDPTQAQKAITEFEQIKHGIVSEAVEDVLDDQYVDPDMGPKFDKTIEDLRGAIESGEKRTVSFDSKTASKDVQHTWAETETSALFGFFSQSGHQETLTKKAATNRVTVDATFERVVDFTTSPEDWYHSDALQLAYGTKDNTVWPAGQQPNWESTFGDDGNLKRMATEMVVVDGIDATITSHASYSEEIQKEYREKKDVGVWPVGSYKKSEDYESDVSFHDDGTMNAHITLPKGNPQILGVNVLPIDKALGH